MITHYLIHSETTGRTLRASYKGGNFFKLEKTAGKKLTVKELMKIGLIVPAEEKEISDYDESFPTISYTKVEKQASTYQQYVGTWFSFYEGIMTVAPKFTKADGMALNQIKSYLTKVGGSDAEGLGLFQLILDNWHKLEDFHKANTDLKYINSRLNVILNAIKKAGQAGTGTADNSVRL
jgi:hypothetical protein